MLVSCCRALPCGIPWPRIPCVARHLCFATLRTHLAILQGDVVFVPNMASVGDMVNGVSKGKVGLFPRSIVEDTTIRHTEGGMTRVKAIAPYESTAKGELSFPLGARMFVVSKLDDKWWQGAPAARRPPFTLPAAHLAEACAAEPSPRVALPAPANGAAHTGRDCGCGLLCAPCRCAVPPRAARLLFSNYACIVPNAPLTHVAPPTTTQHTTHNTQHTTHNTQHTTHTTHNTQHTTHTTQTAAFWGHRHLQQRVGEDPRLAHRGRGCGSGGQGQNAGHRPERTIRAVHTVRADTRSCSHPTGTGPGPGRRAAAKAERPAAVGLGQGAPPACRARADWLPRCVCPRTLCWISGGGGGGGGLHASSHPPRARTGAWVWQSPPKQEAVPNRRS